MSDDTPPIEAYQDAPTAPAKREAPSSVVAKGSAIVASYARIVRFRGRPMVLEPTPYPHFVPLHRENFDKLAYPLLGGVSRSRMGDIFAFLGNTAQDLTGDDHYILFGAGTEHEVVWDMKKLAWVETDSAHAVWRSPYVVTPAKEQTRVDFVQSLAGGDEGLYDDMMQSIAPLVMMQKPDGVLWWVGDGANGKSTLMDAIYDIFPGQLSSITVKRLTDGRDTPSLNGTLANIVRESSEGRVDDTEIYKAIGTHEDFRVHKFHSQDDIKIEGNVHHIFSANQVPTFNDKGYSARRRTFIVPFTQRFESDLTFKERTFTNEMFGQLILEMCRYAVKLREQGYRYKWSALSLAAKTEYDTDANNAEEYAKNLIHEGVVGFDSFNPVKNDYENWCADNGYVPLGITNLRRAMTAFKFERRSYQDSAGKIRKRYHLPLYKPGEMVDFGMGRPGLYTLPGFVAEQPEDSEQPEESKQKSMLDGWT